MHKRLYWCKYSTSATIYLQQLPIGWLAGYLCLTENDTRSADKNEPRSAPEEGEQDADSGIPGKYTQDDRIAHLSSF